MSSNSKPDYAFWDTMDEFSPWETAYLWCEYEPGSSFNAPAKVRAMYEQIFPPLSMEAILDVKKDRNELRRLAEQRGQHPPFLYPEERLQAKSINKPLHEKERATLLAIICALAELHDFESISSGKGDGFHTAAAKLLRKFEKHSPPIKEPCGVDTLRDHLRAALGG